MFYNSEIECRDGFSGVFVFSKLTPIWNTKMRNRVSCQGDRGEGAKEIRTL